MSNAPKTVSVGGVSFANDKPFALIAGPCQLESRDHALDIASSLKELTEELGIGFVFKTSFDKANRTSLKAARGLGLDAALTVFAEVKSRLDVPITTDVHLPDQCAEAAEIVDLLQIPAFLCRQTSLLVAAADTGKVVNVKKGQFVSAEAMKFAQDKILQSGNDKVILTERGTTFGYQDLVVDFRGIPVMQAYGATVVLDCTHSLQQPNQASGVTGGRPALIGAIANAGIAVGVDGLFIETHPRPAEALSDGANMLPLDQLENLLERLVRIREAVHYSA